MTLFRSALSALSALALTLALPVVAAAPVTTHDWRAEGPRTIVLTYHVAPAARVQARALFRARLLPHLAAMKNAGKLRDYELLANRYVDSAVWDFMLTLDFPSDAAFTAWRETEEAMPAGLSPDQLAITSAVETAPGTMVRASTEPGKGAPTYLIVPYDYLVSTDEYLRYVDGYVVPQLQGWADEKALQGFRLFLPRYAAGRTWSALLMLAYRGDEGLAARDTVVKKVRDHLAQTSPAWKAFSDSKANIRNERQPIVADVILP